MRLLLFSSTIAIIAALAGTLSAIWHSPIIREVSR